MALVFLSGLMGTGKSFWAARLANHLGVTSADLDSLIQTRAGASIADIFREHGEKYFREIERDTVRDFLATHSDAVLALGGGTILRRDTRRLLLDKGRLLTLTGPTEILCERLRGQVAQRPLLAGGDLRDRIDTLREERRELYAECHAHIDTSKEETAVLGELTKHARANSILVPLGERSYVVHVGSGNLAQVSEGNADKRALVVCDSNTERYAGCIKAPRLVLKPGESEKNLSSVDAIWSAALAAGLDRSASFVAVGGGVVGDLTGFAASTYMRGVPFVQVPTTLLAMVDSSVGGKTGFDVPQGKNLIGSFHQPSAVYCDLDVLATLEERDLRAGFAEIIKAAWLEGEDFMVFLEENALSLIAKDSDLLGECVRRAVKMKARVVSADERDEGGRAMLNFGHTVGHALEAASNFELRHGEAVAIGMVAAMNVASALGRCTAENVERMRRLLVSFCLPVEMPTLPQWWDFLSADKKRVGKEVRYVLCGEPGGCEIVSLTPQQIRAML